MGSICQLSTEVEVDDIREMPCLESLQLCGNPLRDDVVESLKTSLPPSITVEFDNDVSVNDENNK